jgi:hypothetical protein
VLENGFNSLRSDGLLIGMARGSDELPPNEHSYADLTIVAIGQLRAATCLFDKSGVKIRNLSWRNMAPSSVPLVRKHEQFLLQSLLHLSYEIETDNWDQPSIGSYDVLSLMSHMKLMMKYADAWHTEGVKSGAKVPRDGVHL